MKICDMTPPEAWDRFIGPESPLQWSTSDVEPYVEGSPLCEDLSDESRSALTTLLSKYVEQCHELAERERTQPQTQIYGVTW